MKSLNKLILSAVAGVAVIAASQVQAGEPLVSPRAKDNQIHAAQGTDAKDANLVTNRPAGNARAWELAQSLKSASNTGPSVDLAHGPRPTMSPKDPRYEQELRRLQEVQIAPLK